jgi:hypothetical protein
MRRLLVVAAMVTGILLGSTQTAHAGPSADGSYLLVFQSGHLTHTVCDNRPFWVGFVNYNIYDLGALVFDIHSKATGKIIRIDYILLGGGDGAGYGEVRETRLGSRHDGRALIRFDYWDNYLGPDLAHERGSYSINVVPCPG